MKTVSDLKLNYLVKKLLIAMGTNSSEHASTLKDHESRITANTINYQDHRDAQRNESCVWTNTYPGDAVSTLKVDLGYVSMQGDGTNSTRRIDIFFTLDTETDPDALITQSVIVQKNVEEIYSSVIDASDGNYVVVRPFDIDLKNGMVTFRPVKSIGINAADNSKLIPYKICTYKYY